MQTKPKLLRCHHCDTKIPNNANFCYVCGEDTSSVGMKQSVNHCPDCGEKNDSMWAFCEKCEFHFVSGKPKNSDDFAPSVFVDNALPPSEPLNLKVSKRNKVVHIDISKKKFLFPIAFGSLSLIVFITSAVAFTKTDAKINEFHLTSEVVHQSLRDKIDLKKMVSKREKGQSSPQVVEAKQLVQSKPVCTPYVVAIKKLNIRQQGSLKGKLVGKYYIGDEVCVSKKMKGWLKTPKGWITEKYTVKG